MDPEAVRRSLETTSSAEEITGSTPTRFHFYDPFVLHGVSVESAEHNRLLCSFVIAPRHAVSHHLSSPPTNPRSL
jgi:acyl-coenzyme A thioesterase 13